MTICNINLNKCRLRDFSALKDTEFSLPSASVQHGVQHLVQPLVQPLVQLAEQVPSTLNPQLCEYAESKNLIAEKPATETTGHRKLLECFYCGSKYKSLKHLELHHKIQHVTWNNNPKLRFIYVIVNGKYIEERIKQCKTKIIVFKHKHDPLVEEGIIDPCPGKKIIINSCYLRNCPKCESTRRYRYVKKYKESLLSFKRVSVVTLTFRDYRLLSKREKRCQELQVRNFIKKLLRRTIYKLQYIRVLETIEHGGNLYFYHYHFLFDLPYIEQGTLSRLWKETTETSYVVDIRILRDSEKRPVGIFWNRLPKKQKLKHSSNYITKYLAKPVQNLSNDEYATYVYGSHFVQTHLTCLNGQNSSIKTGLICEECGESLKYFETLPIKPVDHPPTSLAGY
jgi:predicted transcriptional regulator